MNRPANSAPRRKLLVSDLTDMIAPFWTDLNGSGAPGVSVALVSDGTNHWVVIQWEVFVFGTASARNFQVWIGNDGVQDISMTYDPSAPPSAPTGQDFAYGAENAAGQGEVIRDTEPTADQVVTSTAPSSGGSATYSLVLKAKQYGAGKLTTSMNADGVLGTTLVSTHLTIIH